MIGFLFLGFLIAALYYAWLLMRKFASLTPRWQLCVAAVLVCTMLLLPIQLSSGYTLASPWGPLIIFALACVAYVLLMFLLWHKSRIVSLAGLLVPVIFIAVNLIGWLVVLGMVLGNASVVPNEEGRISPIASYRIIQYPGIWGGSTPAYTYEIYKNPRWLPFVWKEVDQNHVPCGPGDGYIIKGFLIRAGANDHTVVVSCTEPASEVRSWQVPID